LSDVQASESFVLLVGMKERIQPKWFAGLHTKATEVLAAASVVKLMITKQKMLMFIEKSQKQKMNMKQKKNK